MAFDILVRGGTLPDGTVADAGISRTDRWRRIESSEGSGVPSEMPQMTARHPRRGRNRSE